MYMYMYVYMQVNKHNLLYMWLLHLHVHWQCIVCFRLLSPRVLEMKNEMVNLEILEFHYFDDILTDMKLTPVSTHSTHTHTHTHTHTCQLTPWPPSLQSDVELPIPRYFTRERAQALRERDKMLGSIIAQMGPTDTAEVSLHVHVHVHVHVYHHCMLSF